jgi:hypothetical protein
MARCAGGPLPRPAFRSFLATAGDPSPNFGGGVVGDGSRCFGKGGAGGRRPPLPASPPQTAWGRGDASYRLPERDRILPFPRAVYRGRGRGMGGAVRRQGARRSALLCRCHQPPPGVFGGGGRVMRARRGRAARAGVSAARSNSPLPPCSLRGKGSGDGGRCPAAGCPPRRPDLSVPSTSPRGFWGRWASNASPEGACGARGSVRTGSNSPLSPAQRGRGAGGEGPGERGPLRAQCDAAEAL